MKTTYNLTSSAREGAAKVTYENGVLIALEIDFKPQLTDALTAKLFHNISANEEDVWTLARLGVKVRRESQPNEKLALFCRVYEKHKGIKYKVSAADSGKIKQIDPSEDLLHFYFRSENFLFKGKQSIANLVKYWNELRADFSGKGSTSRAFPNEWRPELVKKMEPLEYQEYLKHLKSIGLEPIKMATGQIIGFK